VKFGKELAALGAAMALLLMTACGNGSSADPSAGSKDGAWEPNKPITLVIPYGPGGATDTIGRVLADHMEGTLGVPVVVENMAGGVGAVGVQRVYSSAPDGYTMAMASGSIQTIVPHTTELGYDIFNMVFVGSTHESVAARFVSGNSPYQTIEDLVTAGKNGPELVDVTSGGFGLPDIGTAMLSDAVGGLKYRPLATDGGAEAVLRMLAGDGDMGQNSAATTMQYVESGELRPLLIESASWPELEEKGVPTSEKLYGYSTVNPSSILLPPGTPENIRVTLEDAVRAALADETVFEQMSATSELVKFRNGQEAKEYAREGYDRFGPIIEKLVG
jgi:putative tricarboxylic transport membrane protein